MIQKENDRPLALIAMGGHAFIQAGERGTIEEHVSNSDHIAELLMILVEKDYNLVITHGNGPQVGDLLVQNELRREEVPPLPMDVLVAETEGSLGYILQQSLLNQMRKRNIRRYVVTMVTQVLVDENDPAFAKPTKPIGPFLSKEEAEQRRKDLGWEIETLREKGHFPPGSMGPKIEAVIRFLQAGGQRALITDPESLPRAIEGRVGTHFIGRI